MNKGRLTREAADYFTVDDLSFGQSTTTTAHFKIKNFMALFVFHEISVSDFKHLRAMGINLKTVIRPFFYFSLFLIFTCCCAAAAISAPYSTCAPFFAYKIDTVPFSPI